MRRGRPFRRARQVAAASVAALVLGACGGSEGGGGAGTGAPAAAPAALGPQAGTPPAFPGPADTGVARGSALRAVKGDVTYSTAGEVVENRDIQGCVTVTASHVTLRNVRVSGCGREPVVSTGYGLAGIVLEDCEIDGGRLNPAASAVGYDGYTVRRCNIHGTGSGLHMTNNVTVEDSWIHDLHEGDASHNDTVITNGGANFVVRHNRLENPHTQTAVVALFGDNGPVVNALIEGNLLEGGGYTVYGGSVDGKRHSLLAAGIRFVDNRFGRRFFAAGGSFGPVVGFDSSRPRNHWSGNVWHDTGAPVAP